MIGNQEEGRCCSKDVMILLEIQVSRLSDFPQQDDKAWAYRLWLVWITQIRGLAKKYGRGS